MAEVRIIANKGGTDWTANEVAVLLGSYFMMLADELAGRPYSKKEQFLGVMKLIGRTKGSVEFKHQNVSAVLDEIGLPWIRGYKPRDHYQDSLADAVGQYIIEHPELLNMAKPGALKIPTERDILVAPPPLLNSDPESRPAGIRRLIGKFDPAARDERNRALGKAGEEFVVGFERRRLGPAGTTWPGMSAGCLTLTEMASATTCSHSRPTAGRSCSRSKPPAATNGRRSG